jgi:DNA polymerase III delta subunit
MIITLTGENAFTLQTALKELINSYETEFGDMGLERLDGEEAEFQKIYDALTTLPFLVSKKMVVLRAPSANKAWLENSQKLLSDLPSATDVILIEAKLDKRLGYYKFLKAATDFREFPEIDENGLAKWLSDQAKVRQGSLSLADARFLVERVGVSQQLLNNELDKLLLYDSQITRSIIELLTEPAPQSSIFDLLDAAFAGDQARALKLYDEQRALKVEPQQIIAILTWQLRILAVIKTAGNRTAEQIAREASISPYVIRKSSSITHRLNVADIKKIVGEALALDVRLKTESVDADEALKFFLLSLTTT